MYNNTLMITRIMGKQWEQLIDTEGTSLGLYVHSQISQKINIEFTTKSVVINENNWSGHRLSSNASQAL